MPRIFTPMDYWTNAIQCGCVMVEAQTAIAMRLMGVMGLWSVPETENRQMLNEKLFAFAKGTTDASLAAMSGKSPDVVTALAINPIRQTTRANQKRSTNRGLMRA